jgi:azurin
MNWGSDGSMFVGMTARGWSASGGAIYGVQRLEWNGTIPFEMKAISAKADGFEIEFLKPVDIKTARNVSSYQVSNFTYKYQRKYGSPVINQGNCPIKAIEVSKDGMRVRLVVDSLKEGYIHEIKTEGVLSADNTSLLHKFGYYTLNKIPDGEKLAITNANKVMAMAHQHTKEAKSAGKEAVPETKSRLGKHVTTQPASWKTGPDVSLVVGTKPGLKFDIETITVKKGAKVKLTFRNNDDMLHNMVFTKPGTGNKVGEAALKLGLNGERMHFIPPIPDVLFHTVLLRPDEKETIYFVAPEKAGSYPYICSYPGHYLVMKGVLKVVEK